MTRNLEQLPDFNPSYLIKPASINEENEDQIMT